MNAMVTRLAHRPVVCKNPFILSAALWLLLPLPLMSQDVGFVAVLKGQEFAQTSADIVSIGEWRTWHETGEVQNEGEHWEPLHVFEAFAIGTAIDSIISGTVTVPGGAVVDLEMDSHGDGNDPEIGVENGYDSPLELDSARPDGSYTVQLVTQNDDTVNIPLSLVGSAYPPVPHVTNFTSLQSADASADITIEWAAMGGTSGDFIQVSVSRLGGEDDGFIVWETGMPGDPSALDGTDTAVSIPAGELQPGTDYQAELLFVRTTDVKIPPASPALSVAGYYKLTGFRIRTAALAGQPLGAEFLRGSPRDTWSEIPVDSAIAFYFSHPMSPAHISVGWSKDGGPLSTGTFNYQWTQGNTVLLCKFSTNLPPDSVIGWSLNLAGFRDAAGHALSGTADGSFRTSWESEPGTPPDVDFISVIKTRYLVQHGETAVPDGRHEAIVEVDANATNRLKSASVTVQANGRVSPLYCDPWDATEYEAPGEYGSKADLDRFFPNGSYQFYLDGLADGPRSVTLSLGATDQYPDAPTVTNLAALQAVDPDSPATITWNALPGWDNGETFGPGAGLIEFEILDGRDREVFFVDPFELESGTQVEIPAGILKPGKTYRCGLHFLKITDIDETSYPDAIAVAAFESQTVFTIKTTGQPLLPNVVLTRTGGTTRITANSGDPEESYLLETSSDMKRWTLLDVHWNDNAGTYQYDDFDASYFKARFYRMGEYDFQEPAIPPISIQGAVWTDATHTTPVAGATVGTGLDGRTTLTDAQGRFFLITDTPSMGGFTDYTITITSGPQTKDFGPWNWGDRPREQVFEMN